MARFPILRTFLAVAVCGAIIAGLFLLRPASRKPGAQIATFGETALTGHPALYLPFISAYFGEVGPIDLMLDTGAGDTLLLRADVAESVGFAALSHDYAVRGVGGTTSMSIGKLARLASGSIECRDIVAAVGGEQAPPLLRLLEGVIGAGVFGGGRLTLDLADERMRVEPSSDQPAPGQEIAVRITDSRHILTDIELNGRTLTVMIDTGAQISAVSMGWMRENSPERSIVDTHLPLLGVGEAWRTMSVTSIGEIEFAGQRGDFTAVTTSDFDDLFQSERMDGLIGMNWLKKARTITIDYPKRRVWILWL